MKINVVIKDNFLFGPFSFLNLDDKMNLLVVKDPTEITRQNFPTFSLSDEK